MKNLETGRSRGFGFVTFKDPNCVQTVLSIGLHQLDDRTVIVTFNNLLISFFVIKLFFFSFQIDPKSCNAKSAQKIKREIRLINYPKVFLGGLPQDVNETVLRQFFSQYGKVSDDYLI